MPRRVRMGMVGGGRGAFIGAVHRIAARMDDGVELVCGALSSDPARARESGGDLLLAPDRCYGSFMEMIEAEGARPEDERMEFVSIVTPNDTHHPIAKAALEAGFHVLSDKPATLDLAQAKDLRRIVGETGLLYGLTHTYTGYPMVRQARHMVRKGEIGAVRSVVVEYPQGWLATAVEESGQKQAAWRTDPARAGAAGCMGDIGTHAESLAEFVTGLSIDELAADLTTFVPGRRVDDEGSVLLRFAGGAKGVLHASQVSAGCENNLSLRVSGETGGLEWRQTEPNTLLVRSLDGPALVYRTGSGYLCDRAQGASRVPPGHPEGYLEAFANIYREFADDVRAHKDASGPGEVGPEASVYPSIEDGVRSMAFVEAVVASSRANAAWTRLDLD